MSMKWLAFAAVFAVILTGCGNPTDEAADSAKPEVALIMKSLANEFFKTMEEGARDYHTEHSADFDLIVNGIPNEQDLAGQVELVEQMIGRGVNAIVIAPADSKALISVLARAV